jgi:DNA helicase IV
MDGETAKLLFTALGAGSGGAALLALINGMFKWLSGAARREQIRNTTLAEQRKAAIKERDDAEDELEAEILKRREAEEHVAKLQRQIILMGGEPVKHGTVRTEE